ncbi:MAG: hypothetical protein QMD82_03635 [bacterium]|nr:hypothetical protein [bacterium]
MFVIIALMLTYLSIGFQRGFDSNILIDDSNLRDYYSGLNFLITQYSMEKPWGYELSASGNFFDNYSDMNFLTFRGSLFYFKDFGKVGNYMESGVDFAWDIFSPYRSFSVIPGIAFRIYLDEKRKSALIPSWDLHFLFSDESYNLENLPRIRLNTGLWGISLLLMATLKWRYSATYVQSPSAGMVGWSARPNYTMITENLFAGNSSIRLGKKFGGLLDFYYQLDYHFLPTKNLVDVENLKEKLDPLNKEEFAYTGFSHSFIVNLGIKEISINYNYTFGYKDYRIVDTVQSSLPRSDVAYFHSLVGTIPLVKKTLKAGVSCFFKYEVNNSNLVEFSYTRKEFGAGLYLEL